MINPPESSTAAFQIANSSVSILHVNIVTTNTVNWGTELPLAQGIKFGE